MARSLRGGLRDKVGDANDDTSRGLDNNNAAVQMVSVGRP